MFKDNSIDICRAFTFISYHIPVQPNMDITPQYTTIGFFDGLFTEGLDIRYEKDSLRALWKYTLKRTSENKGYYSFQNTFGFSKNEWNMMNDAEFWDDKTNEAFPLTFVVFLQLSDYMVSDRKIADQCQTFNNIICRTLGTAGTSYTYGTIDKNDFIVCIKSKHHKNTVDAIKKLHHTGVNVIYSYSVFSISKHVLNEISSEKYRFIFEEWIDSICLKGITNSYDIEQKVGLDQKYYEFSKKLTKRLYPDEDHDEKIYDILGDDDFRLIARKVNLGKLLQEYADDGILNYTGKEFPYYLFSSSLVLNTLTDQDGDRTISSIAPDYKESSIKAMKKKFVSPNCNKLFSQLNEILIAIKEESWKDEKVTTFSQAVFQLLQSLKILEMAPTKKYDFYSLYHPFQMLVTILESKIKQQNNIGESSNIYEFIHKISMTLHGTLRTDIQFFQIRDFNAIVHYAPAKLRAFYSMWALHLTNYYNSFCAKKGSYSFVLAPGMFRGTSVKQLFTNYNETERLMLVTIPERHLYSPQWLTIIIAHEVSHFVGSTLRNREKRHKTWLDICARIFELECLAYTYARFTGFHEELVGNIISDNKVTLKFLKNKLIEIEEDSRTSYISRYQCASYEFHTKNSQNIIKDTFWEISRFYWKQIEYDYVYLLQNNIIDKIDFSSYNNQEKYEIKKLSNKLCNNISDELIDFFGRFLEDALSDSLMIIGHITTEVFADIMAILTLELTPEEYISSLSKSEWIPNTLEELENQEGTMVTVRIAIALNVISTALKNHSESITNLNSDFPNEWSGDVLEKCVLHSDFSSSEGMLFLRSYAFRNNIKEYHKEITSYDQLYNTNMESFSNNKIGFLTDKLIYNCICEYLNSCTDLYFEGLGKMKSISTDRDDLIKYYKYVSGNSSTQMMQGIESFLEKSERFFSLNSHEES